MKPNRLVSTTAGFLVLLCVPFTACRRESAEAMEAGNQRVEEAGTPQRTKAVTPRSEGPGARQMTADEVIQTTPEEWNLRFKTEFANLDEDIRLEIVALAGEMGDALADGLDPQGTEARAHAEAILVLLADTGRDD